MNGQRCEELFLQVFRKFDYAEACHGAVCIDKRDDLEELASFHVLGIDDPHYARRLVATLWFASLGSSHINKVLRNKIGEVRYAVAATQRMRLGGSTWL